MSCQKFATCRPNDFFYDPLFIVGSKKDYYKQGFASRIKTAKYAVCPVFSSMFSDMPNYPRMKYLMRRAASVPPFIDKQKEAQKKAGMMKLEDEVQGANRYKYFQIPVLDSNTLPPEVTIFSSRKSASAIDEKVDRRTKKTQTVYRESSAQTHPWEPPYKVVDGSDPEILKLDFLKWGAGLPVGMHEIRLIERARMKRDWEKSLPPLTTAANVEKRRKIIDAMERDEWAFREQEIQDIQDLRLELLEQMLNELHEKSACRTEKKMKLFVKQKQNEKEQKLAKLRHNANRELRKLDMKQKGLNGKYRPVNIVQEFADPTSELYAPLMRHGSHPKRWHQVISDKYSTFKPKFEDVENMSTLPSWLDKATKMKDCVCIKMPGTRLCLRETKWTTPVLKHLYEELKNLRVLDKTPCTLRVKIEKPLTPPDTPVVECVDEEDENNIMALIKLQSILRGRATQILIYTGRERCKKLIDEFKTTHSLLEEGKIRQFIERCEVKQQQREQELCLRNAAKLQEILMRLQGTVVGTLLDFLNKELHKLMEERKTHGICLMAERERHRREAAEAGRRQKEIRRRKEHDEMFKQVVKMHQETVDMYLQDIITEGMEFASEQEAKEYVLSKAAEVEEDIKRPIESVLEQEEYIANLVHHFVLPEVEKELIRQKIQKRQKEHLKAVHDAIYENIETLPKPDPYFQAKESSSQSISDASFEDVESNDQLKISMSRHLNESVKDLITKSSSKLLPIFSSNEVPANTSIVIKLSKESGIRRSLHSKDGADSEATEKLIKAISLSSSKSSKMETIKRSSTSQSELKTKSITIAEEEERSRSNSLTDLTMKIQPTSEIAARPPSSNVKQLSEGDIKKSTNKKAKKKQIRFFSHHKI